MTTVDEVVARPYQRVIERGGDGVFTAWLAEIPGAVAEGDSYEEALHNLDEGLADLIEVMIEEGQPIPEPVSQRSYSGRLQVRLTPSLHARAALYAKMEGVSLNRVLSDAVASYVGLSVRETKPARRPAARNRNDQT